MKLSLRYTELSILIIIIFLVVAPVSFAQNVTLYFFFGKGCPHCAQMEPFLDSLKEKYPSLEIKKFEVYFNQSNRELFEKIAKSYNTEIQGVPTVFIDRKVFVGYNKEIGQEIKEKIEECIRESCISPEDILNGTNNSVFIIRGDFSNYEKTQKGLIIFTIMLLLFIVLLFLIMKKRGGKK
ncbi:MAG: hypothetical protein B6U88_01705 [Candidatus Aenigmarchaeota archaeon ex4484_56]|nr:MAG: hypothetical protein B6U88_01705 [Candidatus Aenigmarchaeota archaeon ex4484_56]